MEIKEKDFRTFFRVPFEIRGKRSLFASTFRPDLKKMLSTKNPIFESENDFTYFTIIKNGIPIGRITAHIHQDFNLRFNKKKCYFGFFECTNDQNIANKLFALAEKFARKNQCEVLAGNFNLTAMQEMGIMTNGFENEPYLLQSYGMDYYPRLMKNAGFTPTFPVSTFEIDLEKIDPNEILSKNQRALLNNPEFEFTRITKNEYPKLRDDILRIFNEGFNLNPLFVPISKEEFDFQAKDLVYFMDSHISFIAKHNGMPIGLSIHIPDINPVLRASAGKIGINAVLQLIKSKIKRDRALCVFASVLPEYQNKGVLGAIGNLALSAMKKRGYRKFGITWISESNKGSMSKMRATNAKKLHDLSIFEKQLTHL
jgi:hypothetical protein